MIKHIISYYKEMFNKMNDRRIENKKYNNLYLKIKDANKKFLANGIRYYVMPDPHNEYEFFVLNRDDFTRLFNTGVFRFNPTIKQKLEMSVYVTPERLNQDTINEIKKVNMDSLMKNLMRKLKL